MDAKIDVKLLRMAGFKAYHGLLKEKAKYEAKPELEQDAAIELAARAYFVAEFIPPGYPTTVEVIDHLVKGLPAAGIIQAHHCHRWVACGAPAIRVGHTYAAALIATDVPEDKSEIKPPWPFFYIEVPNDLLKVWDTVRNTWQDIVGITVSYY